MISMIKATWFFLTEVESVYSAVRNESWYKTEWVSLQRDKLTVGTAKGIGRWRRARVNEPRKYVVSLQLNQLIE